MKPSAQQRGVASHTNGAHGRREYSDCCGCLVGVWAHDCVCCSFVPPIVQAYPTKKLSRPHRLCNCVVALDPRPVCWSWPASPVVVPVCVLNVTLWGRSLYGGSSCCVHASYPNLAIKAVSWCCPCCPLICSQVWMSAVAFLHMLLFNSSPISYRAFCSRLSLSFPFPLHWISAWRGSACSVFLWCLGFLLLMPSPWIEM